MHRAALTRRTTSRVARDCWAVMGTRCTAEHAEHQTPVEGHRVDVGQHVVGPRYEPWLTGNDHIGMRYDGPWACPSSPR